MVDRMLTGSSDLAIRVGRGESPSVLTCADGVVGCGDVDDAVLRAIGPGTGGHLGGHRVRHCDFPARAVKALHPPLWRRT